jgi:hypothetical protein
MPSVGPVSALRAPSAASERDTGRGFLTSFCPEVDVKSPLKALISPRFPPSAGSELRLGLRRVGPRRRPGACRLMFLRCRGCRRCRWADKVLGELAFRSAS